MEDLAARSGARPRCGGLRTLLLNSPDDPPARGGEDLPRRGGWPDIVDGQAHVRRTRIPVSVILDCLAAGMSEDAIVSQYPSLTADAIRAAAAHGAALAREEIFPLPACGSSSTKTRLPT